MNRGQIPTKSYLSVIGVHAYACIHVHRNSKFTIILLCYSCIQGLLRLASISYSDGGAFQPQVHLWHDDDRRPCNN